MCVLASKVNIKNAELIQYIIECIRVSPSIKVMHVNDFDIDPIKIEIVKRNAEIDN